MTEILQAVVGQMAKVRCLGRSRVLLRTSYSGPRPCEALWGPGGVDR